MSEAGLTGLAEGMASCDEWHDTGDEDHCGQATKGVWGMPRRQKAMKGVEGCDKPGEAVKQALIPGFPNDVHPIHKCTWPTRSTETSQ